MKINLSDYWRKYVVIIICLILLMALGTAAFCIWFPDRENYILILCVTALAAIMCICLLCVHRLLSYSVLEAGRVSAYSFLNKPLCAVNTDALVFYSIFSAPQGMFAAFKMIAISNESFDCWQYEISKKSFLMSYDKTKIIVLPYEKQVIQLLELDKWQPIRCS